MKTKKAIIIGSGVAGLATAIRLAVKGFDVIVYEKNNYPGGKLSAFNKKGFSFDAGPSLFTCPWLIEELFEIANEPIENYFSYKKLNEACKYFYEDGTELTAFTNPALFAKELNEKLGEDENAVTEYLSHSQKLYNKTGQFFLNHSLHKTSSYISKQFATAFKGVRLTHLTTNLSKYNSNKFKNNKTVQLFNRFATYNGSNPYKAPAMLSMIPSLEHCFGVYYPKGGMISITNALYNLALKKGVQFQFNTQVQRIIYTNNKVEGIVVNNENHFADVVVSNSDIFFTYKNLLLTNHKATKVLKQERSSSALIFYWGMNREFPKLGLHNIFFSTDYKAEFDSIFKTKDFYETPTIYINITSKHEPEAFAPKGKENWFVMINVSANTGQDWATLIPKYKEAIVAVLNKHFKINIEPLIEIEEILNPITIEQKTGSYMGSLYGTSSNSKMAAFLRHANFTSSIRGLYFTGGSVHPGGGIPLCLHSAKIVSNLIPSIT